MASEIRVNTINNSSGLGTITISDTGAVFTGITTIASLEVTGSLVGVANTAIINTQSVNVSGVVTATSFVGDGSALTGLSSDAISEGNTSAEVVDTGSDGHFKVITEGTEALRVDSSQRVGIGDTAPDALLVIKGNSDEHTTPSIRLKDGTDTREVWITNNAGDLLLNVGGDDNVPHGTLKLFESGVLTFSQPAGERARIDGSGRLLVGTSSARSNYRWAETAGDVTPSYQFEGSTASATQSIAITNSANDNYPPILFLGKSRGSSVGSNTVIPNGERIGQIVFAGNDGTRFMPAARIEAKADNDPGANDMPGRLEFSTTADGAASPTERMRITNGGFIKVSNSGSYPDGSGDNTGHYFNHNRTADAVLFIRADSGSYGETNSGALYAIVNRNTTNNSFNIATFTNGNGTGKCFIRDNGDLENTNNSYTGISDAKLKENIVDANSQWDDIKALEFKTYNLIAKPDERHIGVIAQQVEQVSPGLVRDTKDFDADGNDLGTVTKSVKYSILYTKAVKALQEAMERIETLETEKADILARLDAAGI